MSSVYCAYVLSVSQTVVVVLESYRSPTCMAEWLRVRGRGRGAPLRLKRPLILVRSPTLRRQFSRHRCFSLNRNWQLVVVEATTLGNRISDSFEDNLKPLLSLSVPL